VKGQKLRRLRRRRRVDERGIALIMVMGSITLLTVFLTQLQEQTSASLAAALAERDALKAEYYARSAVNLSRLLLASEPEIRKTVAPIFMLLNGGKGQPPQIPVWEFTDLVLGPFNDATGSQSFLATIGGDPATAKNIGLQGGGRFEVTIVDEDAKINLNLPAKNEFSSSERLGVQLLGVLAPQTNNALFEQPDGDNQHSDRQAICAALVDWVDSDPSGNEIQYPCQPNNPNNVSSGPEDNFYQTIGLKYLRKNAAFDSLDEARLVRGMSDDVWTTFVDPEPENPKKRVMTVWGQGEININAANAQTLLAIACGAAPDAEMCNDPAQMMGFVSLVTMGKGMTMGMPLFGAPKDFVDMLQQAPNSQLGQLLQSMSSVVQIKPLKFKDPKGVQKSLRTSSQRFSVYADGIVPGYKRTTKVRIHAVIDTRDRGSLGAMAPPIIRGGMLEAQMGQQGPQTLQGDQAGARLAKEAKELQAAGNDPQKAAELTLQMLNSNPAGNIIYWRVE
jgi:general secretion pathway protein K